MGLPLFWLFNSVPLVLIVDLQPKKWSRIHFVPNGITVPTGTSFPPLQQVVRTVTDCNMASTIIVTGSKWELITCFGLEPMVLHQLVTMYGEYWWMCAPINQLIVSSSAIQTPEGIWRAWSCHHRSSTGSRLWLWGAGQMEWWYQGPGTMIKKWFKDNTMLWAKAELCPCHLRHSSNMYIKSCIQKRGRIQNMSVAIIEASMR